jgi:hypothetical protein
MKSNAALLEMTKLFNMALLIVALGNHDAFA